MNRSRILYLLVGVLAVLGTASAPSDSSQELRSLLDRIDDMWRGRQSQALVTMQVKTEHYERTMKMEAWSQGKERSLIRILSPRKEKGTATLKSGSDIYTYLPKTDRTIRLGSGMMSSSWMGSHFTNDDLVKESRLFDDYHAKLVFEGERDGRRILEIELIPKPEAPVVWGKVVLLVDARSELPLEQRYLDEDMALARTFRFKDPKTFGDRVAPSTLVVEPADAPGERTTLRYERIDFEVELSDRFFSLARLRRRR